MPSDLIDSSPYRIVHDGLLRLHELFLSGKERSEEAEAIRDSSEGLWRELPPEQRKRLAGLSKDLNDIKNVTEVDTHGAISPVFTRALIAQQDGKYDEALELLRANKNVPPFSRVSYLRGRNWQAMGEARTALLFFDHATKLAPHNEEYQALVLGALYDAFPERGKSAVEKVLDEPQAHPAPVIVRACEIRFQETLDQPEDKKSLQVYQQVVDALHAALRRMQTGSHPSLISEAQPVYSVVCTLLATCCRNLGMVDPAFHYYTTAIGLDPLNPPLLIARGAVLYGRSEFAIQDFQRAIQLGTDMSIPYYFLAHYYLHTGQYEQTLAVVVGGLSRKGGKRLKSEMMEYRAIALAALSLNGYEVNAAFQEALKIDDTNSRARRNLEIYEAMVKAEAANPAEQPWALKIDAINVLRELPRPRTLRETDDAQRRRAG